MIPPSVEQEVQILREMAAHIGRGAERAPTLSSELKAMAAEIRCMADEIAALARDAAREGAGLGAFAG